MAGGRAESKASNGSTVVVQTRGNGTIIIGVAKADIADGNPQAMFVTKEELSAIIRTARAWGLS